MWTIREWERKQPVSSVFKQFQAHCHHPNGLTNRTLVSAFVSLWVGMTVANIHLLQVAPTLSLHSLSSHCMVFLFLLICFIPSNLASADPLVPLLAVCVWKTDGCVHLRVWLCLAVCCCSVFIRTDVVSWLSMLFFMWLVGWLVGVCVCGCKQCIWAGHFVRWKFCCLMWETAYFWAFGCLNRVTCWKWVVTEFAEIWLILSFVLNVYSLTTVQMVTLPDKKSFI